MKNSALTLVLVSGLFSGVASAKSTLSIQDYKGWSVSTNLESTSTTLSPGSFLSAAVVFDMNVDTKVTEFVLRPSVAVNGVTWSCSGKSVNRSYTGSCTSNASDKASVLIKADPK